MKRPLGKIKKRIKEDRHETRSGWSQPTSNDAIYRRRRQARYNLKRLTLVSTASKVALLLLRHRKAPRRVIWRILARQLGVSKATICRDVAQLHRSKSPGPADPTFAQILREMKRAGF